MFVLFFFSICVIKIALFYLGTSLYFLQEMCAWGYLLRTQPHTQIYTYLQYSQYFKSVLQKLCYIYVLDLCASMVGRTCMSKNPSKVGPSD